MRALFYAETHQLSSQCRFFYGSAASMPPPDCRGIKAQIQALNPSRYAKHYQQGKVRKQWQHRGLKSDHQRLSNHGRFRRTRWQIQYQAAAADEGLLWIISMMNTTVAADESHLWIVSTMKTTPGVYSREFYYMQKPIS